VHILRNQLQNSTVMHISVVWIGESCSNNQLTNVNIGTALITFSQYIYIYISHKRHLRHFKQPSQGWKLRLVVQFDEKGRGVSDNSSCKEIFGTSKMKMGAVADQEDNGADFSADGSRIGAREKLRKKWREIWEDNTGMLLVLCSELFGTGMAAATRLLETGDGGMMTLQVICPLSTYI
jgi:hypothetical protein